MPTEIPDANEAEDRPERLKDSWVANAEAWTEAVRTGRIESRRLATNRAVLEALARHAPAAVLDVGCGEGWLAGALAAGGVEVVGVDASAPLVEAARARGAGTFHVMSYAEVARDPHRLGRRFDAVVCNFSLLDEDVAPLLGALHGLLAPGGVLVVQTVHPWAARGEAPYRDGWREETFAGFGGSFTAPMPWYYRTLASWSDVLHRAGFAIAALREPAHPETGEPLSLLLECRRS